jgi:urease accessory protein
MSAAALASTWNAHLSLGFARSGAKTVLAHRSQDGPLVVQKSLYPEGEEVCHAIVVHPPGGIAGGDDLRIDVKTGAHAAAVLTTPGANKWYRSAGPWARQRLSFEVAGTLEWLPRETIVFDGALAELECEVRLTSAARYIGWELVCLGRTGSGERFSRGSLRMDTRIARDGKLQWIERAEVEGGGALMRSPVGLAGKSVFGSLIAAAPAFEPTIVNRCRAIAATTVLPGLLIARYLGDSTEDAFDQFRSLWSLLRPAVSGRDAVEPRIWRT